MEGLPPEFHDQEENKQDHIASHAFIIAVLL